jgi:hypothetical protein
METGAAQSTVLGGCVSTARKVYGLQVAQQVQCGGDQGSSAGATKGQVQTTAILVGQGRWRGRGR